VILNPAVIPLGGVLIWGVAMREKILYLKPNDGPIASLMGRCLVHPERVAVRREANQDGEEVRMCQECRDFIGPREDRWWENWEER